MTSTSQTPNINEDQQVKTLDVPVGELVSNGGFTVEVRWIASGIVETTIDYTLEVQLIYHFD